MKRTLADTNRTVQIAIDNQDREAVWATGSDAVWTANVHIDGSPEPAVTPAFDLTPFGAYTKIVDALRVTDLLDDLPMPVPEEDRELLLTMLKGIARTWSTPADVPDWRTNDYIRGQLELVIETCRVATPQEFEDGNGDMDDYRDRITTWIQQEVWK